MHTHRVKWINVFRQLCHLICQWTSPSRPCLAGSELDTRDLIPIWGPFRQDRVLAHKRQQGVLQTSSSVSTQTPRMPRDVCQGLPQTQPSGGCILQGRINPHFTKEYCRWLYKPVVAELRMPPAVPWGTECFCDLMMSQRANSNNTCNSRLARAEEGRVGSPTICQLVTAILLWMGLEFTSKLHTSSQKESAICQRLSSLQPCPPSAALSTATDGLCCCPDWQPNRILNFFILLTRGRWR